MDPAVSEKFDLTNFVFKEGNGVKGLAECGLHTIPKHYIQPVEERLDMRTVLTHESIPIIDMSKWEEDGSCIADSICDVAEKWGSFHVINHGVPLQVLENVKEATHSFFGLPIQEKAKYNKENSPTTNVRYGTSFAPQAEKSFEWKDWLSLFYTSAKDVSALWPKECRDQVLEYSRKCEPMIMRLLGALMKKLNVTDMDESITPLLIGSKRINLNYYPKCPNPELTVGVGRHSDISTLTILLQDDIGGLYVRGVDGNGWVHVPPVSGSLVINVGDALQIISNGRYKSVEHRVVANGHNNRISVPFFVNPRPNDMIGPLPQVLERGEVPSYKQVMYSDYARHFYKKGHDGKKTIDFAKI